MSALREKLHALVDELADVLEKAAADDWVDQKSSPLGRSKHLSLAKRGVLPASREGRRVLIRRSVIDAYLARKGIVTVDAKADEEREVQRLLSQLERKSA